MKLIPQGWFRVVVRAETKSKLVSCATNTLPLLSLLFLPSPFNFPIPPSLHPLRTTPSSKRYTSLPLFPLFFLFMEHETLHDRIKRISFDRRSGRTNKSAERARFVSFRFVDDCERRRSAIVPSRRRRIGPPWEEFWFITSLSRPRSLGYLGYPSRERRSRFPFPRNRSNDRVYVEFCSLLFFGYYCGLNSEWKLFKYLDFIHLFLYKFFDKFLNFTRRKENIIILRF